MSVSGISKAPVLSRAGACSFHCGRDDSKSRLLLCKSFSRLNIFLLELMHVLESGSVEVVHTPIGGQLSEVLVAML